MNKAIYKFYADCGRMGDLQGVFTAEQSEINDIIGETVYFGEVLGKHSEVYFEIKPDQLTMVCDDEPMVNLFEEFNLSSGYNPLNYYEESEDEEEE